MKAAKFDTEKCVVLKDGYLLERLDGEITVFHPTLTTTLYLNETGALIWDLCDGNRRVIDIISLLKQHYPESSRQIEQDVIELIGQLIDNHIAEPG